jgi:hypothetical protein
MANDPRRNHVIGMPSAPLADRRHLPIKVDRYQVAPCLVHKSGFDKGGNDMPVPIDIGIEFCARWPMPLIQARADLTCHGFDVAPNRHHLDSLPRSVSHSQANPRARAADQRHRRPRRSQGGHPVKTTHRLALPSMLTQQAQEVTHAAGLNRLDALVQTVVQQVHADCMGLGGEHGWRHRFQNGTAGAVDLGSGTLRVRVEKA